MCGSVRYRLNSAPFDCGWCHCRTCQLFGGAPALAFATIATPDFTWIEGEDRVRWIQSSSFGRRAFCRECGTPLMVTVNYQPETVDFPMATLDEPDAIAPEFHIFWSSKVAWFNPGDDLPRHDRFRPETRGLEGVEPPDNSGLVGRSNP
jgi:hypothetical protein